MIFYIICFSIFTFLILLWFNWPKKCPKCKKYMDYVGCYTGTTIWDCKHCKKRREYLEGEKQWFRSFPLEQ